MKSKVIYNKVQTLRADDLWQAWLDDLAAQAGRKPSTFIRGVIYCLQKCVSWIFYNFCIKIGFTKTLSQNIGVETPW